MCAPTPCSSHSPPFTCHLFTYLCLQLHVLFLTVHFQDGLNNFVVAILYSPQSLICYSLNSAPVDCKPEILDLCVPLQAGPQSALPQPDRSALQRLSRLPAPSTGCQRGWTGVRKHHWGEWVWWRGRGRRRPACCCGAGQPCAAGESSPQCLQPTHRATGSRSKQWVCTAFT